MPGLALLVAAAIDAVPRAHPALTGAAAVVAAALLVAAATPALHGTYPDEDLRGAVLATGVARGPGTVTIVLPEFAYAWAFYRGGPVMVRHDERAMTGFTPVAQPDVLLLPGFQVTATGERNARLRRAAAAAVEVLVAPPRGGRSLGWCAPTTTSPTTCARSTTPCGPLASTRCQVRTTSTGSPSTGLDERREWASLPFP